MSSTPEPIDWRPTPSVKERVLRAVSAPVLAAGAVFVVAVIVAVVLVMFRPHTVDEGAGSAGGMHIVDSGAAEAGEESAQFGAAGSGPAEADRGDSTGASNSADESDEAVTPVFVHVVGEVKRPGVVEVPGDARVQAAIEAAGGATSDAVLSGVNLARVVADGEQIVVPDAETAEDLASGSMVAGNGASGGAGASGGNGTSDALIHLNSADQAALETLPRVGPALAQRIIEWREAQGGFTSVDQLLEVSGIGPKTLEGFRERVTV